MDSLRRATSNLSISSIMTDSNSKEDNDLETSTKSNAMLKILLEAATDISTENSALGSEILELLNLLKFDLKSLPPDIKDGLQTIAAILKSEGLASIDETELELCLESNKINNKKQEREERLLKAKYNTAFAKYNALEDKLNWMRKEIDQIEDTFGEKMSNSDYEESNRILWSNRFQEYKKTIENLEEELDEINVKDIGIEFTEQKSLILMEKFNELTELNEELSKYNNLPPNLLQAKNALENKKIEQEEIENFISEKLNS